MLKAVLATALLASTTLAYEFVEAYTNEGAPIIIANVQDVIRFDCSYNLDFGYMGYYRTDPNANTRRIRDTMGLRLFSNLRSTLRLELFSHFKFDVEFSFVPLEWVPFAM